MLFEYSHIPSLEFIAPGQPIPIDTTSKLFSFKKVIAKLAKEAICSSCFKL